MIFKFFLFITLQLKYRRPTWTLGCTWWMLQFEQTLHLILNPDHWMNLLRLWTLNRKNWMLLRVWPQIELEVQYMNDCKLPSYWHSLVGSTRQGKWKIEICVGGSHHKLKWFDGHIVRCCQKLFHGDHVTSTNTANIITKITLCVPKLQILSWRSRNVQVGRFV